MSRKQTQQNRPLPGEKAAISAWLEQVRFKRRLFGGVDEADVWKKLQELNELYEAALLAERARYDALLEGRGDGGAARDA
ncbi:MAG: hypothetical protein HUJ67_04960 [Ruminiclostridium sp.]|nr:hypothetical protein [Ruminiclostridium sp.]